MTKEIIERKKLNYDCNNCKHWFVGTEHDIQCPSCDGFNIKLRKGEDE